MCGIAGEFAFEREQVTASVSRMIAALRHRAPDSSGHYISPAKNVLLVNTRLAIVDVGGGTQPLTNEDGSVWITFNGEIYGFAALARQLERRGHRLRTRCDTEVIVHLYEEHGEAFVEHLRGEFAFALYDQRQHTLWLGRDRFGVKPLYYALSPRSLLFGSEIKAIFSSPVIKRALNPSFIYSYLHGLLPPDETAFVGVLQVEPGCLLRVTAAGVEPRRYWQPRFAETPDAAAATVADRESVEEFRRLFSEAVDLRLQGDQESGVYLSSGLDSTAVATQAARLSGRPVKAFTVAFNDPDYDESARAAATAQRHTLDHHVVTIPAAGLAPHFVRSLWHCEMPVVNGHGAAKLLLSGLASQHVKSVLTGEGADELLAGYDLFLHQALLERVRHEPRNRALRAQMRQFLGSVDLLSGTVRATDYAEYDRVVELFGTYPYPALRALKMRRSTHAVLSRECLRGIGDFDPLEHLATTWSSRRLAGFLVQDTAAQLHLELPRRPRGDGELRRGPRAVSRPQARGVCLWATEYAEGPRRAGEGPLARGPWPVPPRVPCRQEGFPLARGDPGSPEREVATGSLSRPTRDRRLRDLQSRDVEGLEARPAVAQEGVH